MTKSDIGTLTVLTKKAPYATADLVDYTLPILAKIGDYNQVSGEVMALYRSGTYRCIYDMGSSWSGGEAYGTESVYLEPGDRYKFPTKKLLAPEHYSFWACVYAMSEQGEYNCDSYACVLRNSSRQESGLTPLPWITYLDRIYKAPEESQQTIGWEIKNYGAGGKIMVELVDFQTEEFWREVLSMDEDEIYSNSFVFTFYVDHDYRLSTYYKYEGEYYFYHGYGWYAYKYYASTE